MADKFRQIQKFVEILGGLVDRSETISKRLSDTINENFALSESAAQVEGEREKTPRGKEDVKNIRLTDHLMRKPPLRVVDMGSGMAYLTFSAHSHLSQKFDLGEKRVLHCTAVHHIVMWCIALYCTVHTLCCTVLN
jgi:hypothetical protein